MFKTILTNLLSIHKPKDDNLIMVRIKLSRKMKSGNKKNKLTWWADIDWHVFKLPNHDQSIVIDDIKIKAEIVK